MKALNLKLLRDLKNMWSQVLTIALVVASGVGGFVSSLSAVDSLELSRDRYYLDGRFADIFSTVKRAPAPVAARLLELPGVADVQTTLEHMVRVERAGSTDPVTGNLIGLDRKQPHRMNLVTVNHGRMIGYAAEGSGQPGGDLEALVSETFASAHRLQPGDRLVALINGKRRTLVITGRALSPEYIFAGARGMPDPRGFGVFWVDHEALAAAYDMEGAFNQVAIQLAPGASERAVLDSVNRVLAPFGGVDAVVRKDQSSHQMLANELKEQRVIGTVLPAIFLAVAAFLLNVVLSRQVSTQREQIATLKAVGYDNGAITWHYLKFVLAVVTVGLLIGIVLGYVLGQYYMQLYAEFFAFPGKIYRLNPWLVVGGGLVTALTAVAGALHAIAATVSLAPAEAMRPPSPGTYRATLLERIGLKRLLSPAMRIIVRNMERKPLRTLIAIGGMAASLAIVVIGNFSRDAIDYIVNSTFNFALRSDVTVSLVNAGQASIGNELARQPGVLAVEAGRDVAVRFVNGHHEHRGAIQGFANTPELRRVIDGEGEISAIPADGLLLTDRLADKLHLKTGDRLEVEILEGDRRTQSVVVAALTTEMMGLNAYMRRDAVNRLLHEGDLATNFGLLVERGREPELLSRLRDLPRAAGTFSKATMLRNLEEISARNIRIISAIMTAFALVIAIGVVYNSARVALAERAWELASLRVLGFRRREVSILFFGEIAIQLLIAMPLGMLMGYGLTLLILDLLRSDQFSFPLTIRASTYAFAALSVAMAAVVSGLIVQRRINRLDLVGVLKTRE